MTAFLTDPGSIARADRTNEGPAPSSTSTPAFSQENNSLQGEDEPQHVSSPFLEFLRLFAEIHSVGDMTKIFPKTCRVCGHQFDSFKILIRDTEPKGHVFEDCEEVMNRPYTMVYRHCPCSNTLVVTLTAETFPPLVRFWPMLRQEAERSGKSLTAVVRDFSTQCDRYVLDRDGSRTTKTNP